MKVVDEEFAFFQSKTISYSSMYWVGKIRNELFQFEQDKVYNGPRGILLNEK